MRPIAAEHQALEAKQPHHSLHKRLNPRSVGDRRDITGNEPGYFARNVGAIGDGAHEHSPWLTLTRGNARSRHVINHEAQLGMTASQLRDGTHLARLYGQIECQVALAYGSESALQVAVQ